MDDSHRTTKFILIEVAYALPDKQQIVSFQVAEGTSLREAVIQSGIQAHFPGLNLAGAPLGVFGKQVAAPEAVAVKPGDRIEIYRPLIIDPKEARRNRAAKAKAEKTRKKPV